MNSIRRRGLIRYVSALGVCALASQVALAAPKKRVPRKPKPHAAAPAKPPEPAPAPETPPPAAESTPSAAAPSTEPTPAPAAEATPAPEPPPPPAAAEPAPATEPMKKEPEPAMMEEHPMAESPAAPMMSSIAIGVGLRASARAQNGRRPSRFDGQSIDTALAELRVSGEVTPNLGWTANIVANGADSFPGDAGGTGAAGTVRPLDVIARVTLNDYAHLWAGRLLVPVDRTNLSGPWGLSTWNFPGTFKDGGVGTTVEGDNLLGANIGPKYGPFGRDLGATFWGQVKGGLLKYYAGMFQLGNPRLTPLFVGRVNLSLINPEPGYLNASTYFGTKDIVAIGIGGEYQKNQLELPATQRYWEFNADLLAEHTLGPSSGTITAEGAYYKFGAGNPANILWVASLAYLLPQHIGPGRLQPVVRFQDAFRDGGSNWTIFDGFLGYIVDGHNARIHLGWEHIDLGNQPITGTHVVGNALQLGVQLQH